MSWNNYLNKDRLKPSSITFDDTVRNAFESDFGRVIFSPAIRRMHDKTQVFPLTTDDHIHSRLTHSMEVMAIGYSLGVRLCANDEFVALTGKKKDELLREIPIILKNSCLVHDIGNPPFGHFGETVIQTYFKKLFKNSVIVKEHATGQEVTEAEKQAKSENKLFFKLDELQRQDFELFDGNAQGFRILTKLQALSDVYGLNLTYATLGAFLKYPNADGIDEDILAKSKRGIFQSEREYLNETIKACNLQDENGDNIRHPLSFLMEAADSICYLTMDIEDGFNKNWYSYEEFEAHLMLKIEKGKLTDKKEEDDVELIEKLKEISNKTYAYGKEISKMVSLRIYLIERLVKLAIENFLNNLPSICDGTYAKELIKDDEKCKLTKKLSIFCGKNIFPKKDILSLELTGHAVLTGLMDYYINFVFHDEKKYRDRAMGMISNSIFRTAKMENGIPEEESDVNILSDYYKLRIIVDFITGMTDQFALDHYQKLSGQKIS